MPDPWKIRRTPREQVMAIFGVTEEDMAALDALEEANGYTAAKQQAAAERKAFVEVYIPHVMSKMTEDDDAHRR